MPKGKNKNVTGLMKYVLGKKIMTKFVGLKAKTYTDLIDDGSEDKKSKDIKKCVIKKLKFENHKNCLEATELDNKRNSLEKYEINVNSLKKDHEESIKNNMLILNTQQGFKSERYNVFSGKVNKIPLSLNDDKRMQSIDSKEIYAYGTSKDLVCEKEEIKCNNIIRRYKNL